MNSAEKLRGHSKLDFFLEQIDFIFSMISFEFQKRLLEA